MDSPVVFDVWESISSLLFSYSTLSVNTGEWVCGLWEFPLKVDFSSHENVRVSFSVCPLSCGALIYHAAILIYLLATYPKRSWVNYLFSMSGVATHLPCELSNAPGFSDALICYISQNLFFHLSSIHIEVITNQFLLGKRLFIDIKNDSSHLEFPGVSDILALSLMFMTKMSHFGYFNSLEFKEQDNPGNSYIPLFQLKYRPQWPAKEATWEGFHAYLECHHIEET